MNNCENCIDNRPRIGRLAGVTRTLRLAIYEGEGVPTGTPQDLTGNDVVVRVLRDGTEDIYLPGFVVEGDDHNVIKFEWPAAEQAVGNYTIDVTVTDGSGNVNRVNWHGPTGIRLVEYSYQEYGEDAVGQASSEGIGLVGYYTTNGVGMSAYDEWLGSPESEGWPQTVSGFMAYLKQPATDAAAALEQVVNEKMAEVDATMAEVQEQADADHTRAESDHTRAGSDHTTATGDHTRAEADHEQAVTDSQQAATDHQQAESDATAAARDREAAAMDRAKAADDRQQAAADHATAAQDHATAGSDHQQAQSDHSTASADHTQAVQDAERAASDHTRAGDDHDTAVADHQQAEADHTRAEQDHTASAAATGAANEAAQTATEAAEAADTARESIADELAKKANVEGYYGGLTAGSAENLVGRGSVESEIQGIRTSAGQEDIGTGAAIIREVRGKSLVWNQLIANGNFADGTNGWDKEGGLLSTEGGILTYTKNDATTNLQAARLERRNVAFPAGHKYYYAVAIRPSVETVCQFGVNGNQAIQLSRFAANVWKKMSGLFTPSSKVTNLYYYCNKESSLSPGDTVEYKQIILIDLTLMFGAGNEPTTVEEFERMFFLPYYEYNAGTIINNEATGLRTRGFNLYNPVTGKAVLPGKYSDYPYEYEICGTFTSISFEDYAGNVSTPELSDGRFFNVDAPGVLTVVGGNATNTCVHLVWSGWRNYGEPDYVFEPYWENTLQINTKTITGKLNGEGESVVIFPDGMRGVGTAYDRLIVDPDGFARRAIVSMGIVDMGSFSWNIGNVGGGFYAHTGNIGRKSSSNNMLVHKYATISPTNTFTDKSICQRSGSGNENWINAFDSAYANNTETQFKSAMSGIELVYELATPLEYVLDTPIPLTYMVDDFGIEAKLPVDTAELPTGPLRFAVTYPFNAVDKLRRQRKEMVPANNFDQFLVLLGQAYGGTWNRTYDATADDQKFTYTPPESEPTGTTETTE